MAIQIKGLDSTGGYPLDVDINGNVVIQEGFPILSTIGGSYTVAGQLSTAIAASLAANTTLMSMRFSTTSTRKAYVTRMRLALAGSTFGAAGTVPGILGLQRFNTATPTGGTARIINKQSEGFGSSGSDMFDIRDNNAALTVTSVSFGTVITSNFVPLFLTGGTAVSEWIMDLDVPVVLNPGDGVCLRTQTAMPATQTWVLSYTFHWYEK